MNNKLLIIGGGGFIGSVLAEHAITNGFQVVATFHNQCPTISSCKWVKLDLPRDEDNLIKLIKDNNPDVVVDSIGDTNVESCEANRPRAYYLNTTFTERAHQICTDNSVPLIYLSTDYVFNGVKGSSYTEEDLPDPVNYYGTTKLLGERAVSESTRNLVIRTSTVYSNHQNCRFLNFVLGALLSDTEIQLYRDISSCPTLATDLCKATLLAINKKLKGIYHFAGSSCLTRYQFGMMFASSLNLNTDLIKGIKFDETKEMAIRPRNTCLSNAKASTDLGIQFATVDEGLGVIAKMIVSGSKREAVLK